MAILHVRNFPDEIYQRLQQQAMLQKRSLSAQVITLLERALEDEEKRETQATILAELKRRRFKLPAGATDSVEMLRQDRNRKCLCRLRALSTPASGSSY